MNDIEFCEDCISKADALKLNVYAPIAPIVEGENVHWEEIILTEELRKLPSVLPKAKKGHWIKENRGRVEYSAVCSECGDSTFWSEKSNFCPNCGAKMVEPQESENKQKLCSTCRNYGSHHGVCDICHDYSCWTKPTESEDNNAEVN